MSLVQIAVLILQLSIVLVVFSLGLEASLSDAASLFHRPSLLFRSLFSMNVIMPAFAVFMAATLQLNPAVETALILLAVSPVPPVLPRQQLKMGGSSRYVEGLFVATALISVLLVPVTIELLGRVFAQEIHIGQGAVAKIMATTILAPLAAGMLVRSLAPELARKARPPLSKISLVLLLSAAAVPLSALLPGMAEMLGDGTLLAIVVFVMAGTAIGHFLGGPDRADRSTLALATASRHPGVAMAIAGANYPAQRKSIAAAILLYFVVKAVVLLPYNSWCKRRLTAHGAQGVIVPRERAA
jgi:bile acid:Na+ symporter, BASS family